MPLTTDFFTDQIIDLQDMSFREESIMSKGDSVPNWVLWFTAENNPRFTCRSCAKLVEPVLQVAQSLHIDQPEANYFVGKVNCVDPMSSKICIRM